MVGYIEIEPLSPEKVAAFSDRNVQGIFGRIPARIRLRAWGTKWYHGPCYISEKGRQHSSGTEFDNIFRQNLPTTAFDNNNSTKKRQQLSTTVDKQIPRTIRPQFRQKTNSTKTIRQTNRK